MDTEQQAARIIDEIVKIDDLIRCAPSTKNLFNISERTVAVMLANAATPHLAPATVLNDHVIHRMNPVDDSDGAESRVLEFYAYDGDVTELAGAVDVFRYSDGATVVTVYLEDGDGMLIRTEEGCEHLVDLILGF